MIHKINVLLHVLCGTAGMLVGIFTILAYRRTARHKRLGKYFLYLISVVVTTGFLGWLFFRSNPFLLMLTLLAGYVSYAGFRNIKLREKRSSRIDVAVATTILGCGIFYLLWLQQNKGNWSPSVVYSTLGALILVTVYDITKHLLLHERIKTWWLYEHIYKMVSAFSALLSAFAGTVLPDSFKPYSQVGPSAFCIWLIIFFIAQQAWIRHKNKKKISHPPLAQQATY